MADNLFEADDLRVFARDLFAHAGLPPAHAAVTADTLVEGDLMGHTTHGLALLGPYLGQFQRGAWTADGAPTILSDAPAAQTWDGNFLSGPWLTTEAANWASARAAETGLASVAIGRSAHIAALAAYLRPVAEAGQMIVIASSDPAAASVAPFGGTRRLVTPNPLAAGWPSPGGSSSSGPVMLDVSMSITTNGMTNRKRAEGAKFDHPWLLDADGLPTNDPEAFFTEPGGTLMPLGGTEAGHKGYALALLVEAMTSGLAGFGRAARPAGWGASTFVLVIDPRRFAGAAAFATEAAWMADAVAANPAADPANPPRLPGARALALRTRQLAEGVALHPSIPPVLRLLSEERGIAMPNPL